MNTPNLSDPRNTLKSYRDALEVIRKTTEQSFVYYQVDFVVTLFGVDRHIVLADLILGD